MSKQAQRTVLTVIATIALAVTYLGIGFALCAGFPMVTRSLSNANSAFDASPHAHDELVELAIATRGFTVDDGFQTDEEAETAVEKLAHEVLDAATASAASSEKGAVWTDEAREFLSQAGSQDVSASEAMYALSELDPAYGLDREAVSHLEDVNAVVANARTPLIGVTLIAAFCLMCLVYLFGAKAAGRALFASGCAALGAFALAGLWAIISFESLFACLHGLFFAEGTWLFPADSLLIQMYPEGFWVGMGAVWLASSALVAVVSIIIGAVILRKRTPKAEEPFVPAGEQA